MNCTYRASSKHTSISFNMKLVIALFVLSVVALSDARRRSNEFCQDGSLIPDACSSGSCPDGLENYCDKCDGNVNRYCCKALRRSNASCRRRCRRWARRCRRRPSCNPSVCSDFSMHGCVEDCERKQSEVREFCVRWVQSTLKTDHKWYSVRI